MKGEENIDRTREKEYLDLIKSVIKTQCELGYALSLLSTVQLILDGREGVVIKR